jgi:hypothetical protein
MPKEFSIEFTIKKRAESAGLFTMAEDMRE